jgi:hypothetical protein
MKEKSAMWKTMPEQQQRGAQTERRKRGAAPDEAVGDRAAQDHDYADLDVSGGEPREDIDYPAEDIEQREGDITPSAPDPHVDWDELVQPERVDEGVDDLGEAGEDIHGDIEKGA